MHIINFANTYADSVPLLTVDDLGPIPNKHQYYFASDSLKHCFNITANENEDINEPNTATFTMAADPTALLWPESIERIDMDDLHIVILDNDGKRGREGERERGRGREREREREKEREREGGRLPCTRYRVAKLAIGKGSLN